MADCPSIHLYSGGFIDGLRISMVFKYEERSKTHFYMNNLIEHNNCIALCEHTAKAIWTLAKDYVDDACFKRMSEKRKPRGFDIGETYIRYGSHLIADPYRVPQLLYWFHFFGMQKSGWLRVLVENYHPADMLSYHFAGILVNTDMRKLWATTRQNKVHEVLVVELMSFLNAEAWIDEKKKPLRPIDVLNAGGALYQQHWRAMLRADLTCPILVEWAAGEDRPSDILDGLHRLMHAVCKHHETISVQVVSEEQLKEAEIKH
jgi:hypothetical protein